MNKLEQIRTAVTEHFAAKEANDAAYADYIATGMITTDLPTYNSNQHAAMLMLRDLLPLLDAEVAYKKADASDGKLCNDILDTVETEVAKLLEEVE